MKKVLLVLVTLLLVLAGCSSNGQGDDGDFTFIVRASGEPANFNPDMKSDDYAWAINQNLFNRLVKLTADNTYVADLAESWEYGNDNKTLTFKLKPNVKWHDGEAFSSADVKWTYDTIIAESWSKSDTFANVESIETPDDNTVVFNMKEADAAFISKLSWYATFIMPKHIYEGTDYANNPANMAPIGTGPFKFVSYESGVATTLAKNEDFFGEVPEIDTLVFQIIPDEATAFEAFKKGEVDYLGSLPTSNINDLDGDDAYRFKSVLGINRSYIAFNFNDDVVSDIAVRQAIAAALDQQSVFDRVGGVGEKSTTFISPVFKDYINNDALLPETNVENAIAILEAAGYTKNANGYYLELTLDGFESGNFKDIATIIASNLEKAGIKLTIDMSEMSAWQTKVLEDKNFQITMLAGYQGPDVDGVSSRVATWGSTNVGNFNSSVVDEAFKKGVSVTEVNERKPYYYTVQDIMAAELPLIPIIDNGYKYAMKNAFTGQPEEVADKAAGSEFTYVKRAK